MACVRAAASAIACTVLRPNEQWIHAQVRLSTKTMVRCGLEVRLCVPRWADACVVCLTGFTDTHVLPESQRDSATGNRQCTHIHQTSPAPFFSESPPFALRYVRPRSAWRRLRRTWTPVGSLARRHRWWSTYRLREKNEEGRGKRSMVVAVGAGLWHQFSARVWPKYLVQKR